VVPCEKGADEGLMHLLHDTSAQESFWSQSILEHSIRLRHRVENMQFSFGVLIWSVGSFSSTAVVFGYIAKGGAAVSHETTSLLQTQTAVQLNSIHATPSELSTKDLDLEIEELESFSGGTNCPVEYMSQFRSAGACAKESEFRQSDTNEDRQNWLDGLKESDVNALRDWPIKMGDVLIIKWSGGTCSCKYTKGLSAGYSQYEATDAEFELLEALMLANSRQCLTDQELAKYEDALCVKKDQGCVLFAG